MFGLVPAPYKILGGAFAAAVLLGAAYWAGWDSGRSEYIDYKARVEQTAEAQKERIEQLEQQRKEALDDSRKQVQDAADSISAYYRSHPVIRVLPGQVCASGVPQTTEGAQGPDGPAPLGYVSPYSPLDTEQVASRLDQLQKYLKSVGATTD